MHGNRFLAFGRLGGICSVFIVIAGIAIVFISQRAVVPIAPSLSAARTALANGDYDRAERLAVEFASRGTNRIQAIAIAGEAATKAGRVDAALQHYKALSRSQLELGEAPLGLFYEAETCLNAHRLTDAEALYEKFLTFAPNHVLTHQRIAFLMSVTGRRWESIPHFFSLVRSGKSEETELVLFADLDRPNEQTSYVEDCQKVNPGDKLVQLGLAAHALWDGKTQEGTTRLEAIVSASPELIAGQAMLGELLVKQSDDRFIEWHRRLPRSADRDPDIHYVRGLWARQHDQPQVAARCFLQAIRIAPTHRRATVQLGQQLRALGHPDAEIVESRSRQLVQLTQGIDEVLKTKSERVEPFRDVALLLEQVGRIWESAAWGIAAERQFPQAAWPRELLTRLAGQLTDTLPLVVDRENLALRFDLSGYPEFDLSSFRRVASATRSVTRGKSTIRFEDSPYGPDFTYFNGGDPATEGARMFEQNGGGVAVLDYDSDHWPDLFFPQGGTWRTGQSKPEPPAEMTDRLFRNVEGRQALDVTVSAGLVDTGFGQGAAAGDFDNDGFVDLYVANIGRNQLLHNNGDGTFSDVTERAGFLSTDWTASCVIVDLNADGNPDIYDVNYVTGEHVYEMICRGKACSPKVFAGAPDRLYLSRGDGTFELVVSGSPEVDGKGLGVVAFRLLERDRPSLFIANDQVPNFLLDNRPTNDRHNIRLENEAFIRGAALNQDGIAMASMGIAADDVDGDGRIDFYVSTFKDEPRTLLLQDSAGFFIDNSSSAGLRAPLTPFVGWGTQCLDADRDGNPDIVVVNGHVDDYRDVGGEYHMRPQFFHNLGSARFEELTAAQIGPFFEQQRLGRGLSRLDWNRDGLMDFAVSNIGDRASLVMNATRSAGHFVNVRLTACQGARDAIGSVIEVRCPDRTWRKQLVAGDGYMASNERLIQFGLADASTISELSVHWPSGNKTTIRQPPVDVTIQVIESASHSILHGGPHDADVVGATTIRDE